MRALRPPSRYTLRRASREEGKPAAASAIIASIFAIAFVIKLLPATRQAPLPVAAQGTLPSRALQIWSATPEGVPSVAAPLPMFSVRENIVKVRSVEPTSVEPTAAGVQLTFEVDPGDAPLIPATASIVFAFPMTIAAVHAETEIGKSPLVMPFAKTASALRVAFVKTENIFRTLRP